MVKSFLVGLMTLIIISCSSQKNNLEGKWASVVQHDYENQIEYIFTHDKYQVIINGEEKEIPLSYKIISDTIIMDRGEHWIPIVGIQNRYIKEVYSISNGIEGTTLILGDLILKKVKQ